MIRRQARERREYLYRKALESQNAAKYENHLRLKAALAAGKELPKDIADDEQLQKDYQYDESIPSDRKKITDDEYGIDDEYAHLSGVIDPKIVVTTSRDPSTKLAQFAKEIKLLLPTSVRVNRGNTVMPALVSACQTSSATDLILLHEHRGKPTSMVVSHFPHGPTAFFTLHNVQLRHDSDIFKGTVSEVYPHLIFENFNTKLGKRIETVLKHLFPPGVKKDSSRVVSFINKNDYISVRHHMYAKVGKEVVLSEVGPRFDMRLYELRLGTVENKDADVEWHLSSFTRTANKKDYL